MKVFPDIWSVPYGKSQLQFFVGQATGALDAGEYVFDGTLQDFIVHAPLVPQSLYFFLDFDFSVDCAEADYTGAIQRVPLLSVYQSTNPQLPIFRQPFATPVFYRNKWILQGMRSLIAPNNLQFSLTGRVKQTPALLDKETLKATVQFTAYEITDPDFIKRFMDGLDVRPPAPPAGAPAQPGQAGAMEGLARVAAQNPQIRMEDGLQLPA